MSDNKDGGVTLLQEEHLKMTNPWGKPVVGWQPNSQGVGGLHNPMGYGMMRVVVQKMVNGVMTLLYDQPVIVENIGSIVITQLDGRVGLVRNFRMVGERLLPNAGATYIRRLQNEGRWDDLAKSLGRWCWEAPRGLAPPQAEGEELKAFILRTAKIEALEEAGFCLKDARIVGLVNVNPTFFPHAQYVVQAQLSGVENAKPENLEIIGSRQFFTMQELRALNNKGEFDDGLTLAALALCGLSLP